MNFLNLSIFVLGFFIGIEGKQTRSCNCVCGARGRGNRIVGGTVTMPNEFPWMAGLFRLGKLYCGAALVSESFLITAAHCVDGLEPSDIKVYLGGHNITKDFTDVRRVKAIHQHENFNIFSFDNDIALLKMNKPVRYGPKVQPACLPDGSVTEFTGSRTIIAGWGRTSERSNPSSVLQSVTVPIWSREQCLTSGYGSKKITQNMICGGYYEGGKDACQGDSGGPLQFEGPTGSVEVIGITSWGRGCARPNLPGIYTNVVRYLDWIHGKMQGECMCKPKVGSRTPSNYDEVSEEYIDLE